MRDPAEFTRTARALQEVPLAYMVEASALGVIEAQRELDRRNIEIVQAMGDPNDRLNSVILGGRRRSLLELGLSPTFYQFTEATFTFIVDITVQESEEFSISATVGAAIGEGGASSSRAPSPSSGSRSGIPSATSSSSSSRSAGPSASVSSSASQSTSFSSSSSTSSSSSAAGTPSVPSQPSPGASSGWEDVEVVDDDE